MIYIMINLYKLNKNILLNEICQVMIICILTFVLFHLQYLTVLWWCLFFCIWHWRGGVIVRVRIITTFNLPSMRWWWWRTMNINYWCPWRSHNLKLNEKNMKKKRIKRTLFFSFSLWSNFSSPILLFSLSLSFIDSLCMYVCIICD